MKKFTVILMLLIINAYQLSAQKSKNAIYLKNGSIIYGTLIEITDNQYKVMGKDGSIYLFPGTEIDKYLKESSEFEGRKKSGMGFSLEAGFLIGAQTTDYVAPFSFNTIIQYTFDTKNIMGLGTGAEFIGKTYTPLYFEFKRIFNDRKSAPFIFVRTGMLFFLGADDSETDSYYPYYNSKDYQGGASLTAGTGISWAGEDLETYLSFAYRYAHTSYVQSEYKHQDVTYENNYNRLEIKFGFKF